MANWYRERSRSANHKLTRGRLPSVVIRDRRLVAQQRPLGRVAEKLLGEYLGREAFWRARESGVPTEFAGKHLLGLAKTRSHEVVTELKECGGPQQWFRVQALLAIQQGRMPSGRETKASVIATKFFEVLAGNSPINTTLIAEFQSQGDRKTIDEFRKSIVDDHESKLKKSRKSKDRDRERLDLQAALENLDYTVYSNIDHLRQEIA